MGQLKRRPLPLSSLQAVVTNTELFCIVCQPYLGQLRDKLENVCQVFSFHNGSRKRDVAILGHTDFWIVKDVEKFFFPRIVAYGSTCVRRI